MKIIRYSTFIFSILSAAFLVLTWHLLDQNSRNEYQDQVYSIASTLDLNDIRQFSGDSSDLGRPVYQRLKQQLMAARGLFPGTRFLYLMGQKEDGRIFFFVDSEPPGSADESPPGQVYSDATEPLQKAFTEKTPCVEGPVTDDWGTWISAFVPLADAGAGEAAAVFGMDTNASDWNRQIASQIVFPALMLAAVNVLGWGSILLYNDRRKFIARTNLGTVPRWYQVALTFLVGSCVTALLVWYGNYFEGVSRWEIFERLAQAGAEEISSNLRDVDRHLLEGLRQFFMGSDFVSRDEFDQFAQSLVEDPLVSVWGWAPQVPARDRPAFERMAHEDGLSAFEIWEFGPSGEKTPAAERDNYYPIYYTAPNDPGNPALGFDLASEPARRAALEEAARTGLTSAADPVLFVHGTDPNKDIVLFKPVMEGEIHNRQIGFVTAAIQAHRLLQINSAKFSLGAASIYIDFFQVFSDGREAVFLAGTSPEQTRQMHVMSNLRAHPEYEFTYILPVFAFGKTYAAVVHPSPVFAQLYPVRMGKTVGVLGGLLTLIFAVFANFAAERNRELTRLVNERTQELADSERRFRIALKNSSILVFQQDADLKYTWIYDPGGTFRPENVTGKTDDDLFPPESAQLLTNLKRRALETKTPIRQIVKLSDGEQVFHCDLTIVPTCSEDGRVCAITCSSTDITEHILAAETIRLHSAALNSSANAIVIADREGKIEWVNPAFTGLTGYSLEEAIGRNPRDLVKSGYHDRPFYEQMWQTILSGQTWHGEITNRRKDGSIYVEEMTLTPVKAEGGSITHFVAVKQDVTSRKQAEKLLRENEERLRLALAAGNMGTYDINFKTGAVVVNDTYAKMLGYAPETFVETQERWLERLHPEDAQKARKTYQDYLDGKISKYRQEFRMKTASGDWKWVLSNGSIVERDADGRPLRMTGTHIDITEIKTASLRISRLLEESRRRLRRLGSLREIDQAINSKNDLGETLEVLLTQVRSQLQVDAAAVFLYDDADRMLRCAGAIGFYFDKIKRAAVRYGSSLAGKAAESGKIIHLSEFPEDLRPSFAAMLEEEGFEDYFGAPLVVKGEVKGVLELYHRSVLTPDEEWMSFFETLAGQAALAVETSQLFEGMRKANEELTLAYDATIEGWSRALDLRDHETEGHTQRVTRMALALARKLGFEGERLVHIRRGALLHDIGKMGMPDSILLKPGVLTEEERAVMEQHPVFAYEMLQSIEYLRPALEIPYCHHEKWDGTGYPLGLAGEEIPLPARLFALADVFDALTSERPYRPAWPVEKALEYIEQNSGKHFDPNLVPLFLELVRETLGGPPGSGPR